MVALNNKIMDEIGLERIIDQTIVWDKTQWFVTPGKLSKVIVLSTVDSIRTPLYKIQRKFHDLDAETLLGIGIDETYLNDDAFGRALDRIAEQETDQIFQKIALNALMHYKIAFSRIHSDTTSVSFYGSYETETQSESEATDELQIVRGYNKDHRHECKQLVYGQMTTEHGIPLATKTLDGNTSDVAYNQLAIEIAAKLFEQLGQDGVYIADSKLMTSGNLKVMMNREKPIRFISRAPSNFGNLLEARVLKKAYDEEGKWIDVGTLDENEKKKACHYWIQNMTEDVLGYSLRAVAVKSSAGIGRVSEKLIKLRKALEDSIVEVGRKTFACKADAEKEYGRFLKSQKNSLHSCSVSYTEVRTAQRGRGRPTKAETELQYKSEWKLAIQIEGLDTEAYEAFRQMEEGFVLISNAQSLDGVEILKQYKGQMVVENEFRALKEPCIIPAVFLKKPERIKALMMLISVALLVRALVQYRLRRGVKAYKGMLPKVGRNGGKLQDNPTYNFLKDEMIGVEFKRVSKNVCDIIAPSDAVFKQAEVLLEFIGYDLEQLLN